MPKDVAVCIPGTGIVCIECDCDARLWRHKDGVAESPIQRLAIDFDHLKRVSMQVHWMRHTSFINELQRDPLTALYLHLSFLAAWMFDIEDNTIDGPLIQ